MGRSITFFPLVGLFIGAILAGINWVLFLILPSPVVTGLLIASLVVITGALHLDGFMDSMDGLFIGGSAEKRLEVMKDSRVGSFGVAGAFLLLSLKYLSLENIPEPNRIFSLLIMPVLSRWCVVWPMVILPYARSQGLGYTFKSRATITRAIAATIITLAIAFAFFKISGIFIMTGLWLIIMLSALFIKNRISGLSGDSYGALIELGDLTVLILLLAFKP